MPLPHILHALVEQPVALIIQRHNMRNGRRCRGLVLFRRLCEFLEIKIVAAAFDGLALFHRPLAHGKDRKSRRNSKCLLHRCQHHIPAELVEMDWHTDHRTDRIDQNQHVRIFLLHHLRDVIKRIDKSGAGFAINKRDRGYFPDASFLSISSTVVALPHSTLSSSTFFPQLLATSAHLSLNAPHIVHSTVSPSPTRLRIAPSQMPDADDVLKNTFCSVNSIFLSISTVSPCSCEYSLPR